MPLSHVGISGVPFRMSSTSMTFINRFILWRTASRHSKPDHNNILRTSPSGSSTCGAHQSMQTQTFTLLIGMLSLAPAAPLPDAILTQ